MVEIECRGEPYVRPRTKTSIEPMVENIYKSFAFGHRFDTGFCSRANIRFAPTFIFGHRLKKYTRTALSPINWIRPVIRFRVDRNKYSDYIGFRKASIIVNCSPFFLNQNSLLRKKENPLGAINSQEFQNEIIIIMATMIFQFFKTTQHQEVSNSICKRAENH
jgi:hypothetical protein